MTGGGGLTLGGSHGKCRWVGRAGILSARPHLPQWTRYLALNVSFLGVVLVWSCEMARASPFLLSLGVSKSMMSIVFLAGPLSGLIVQPLVGVLSDGCKSRLGRRRPFIIGGCILTSLSVLMLGWSKEIASIFATEGTKLHTHLAIACAVLSVYIIDFSVNVIQAMDRSLLVDVVSPSQQQAANAWAGRMFGFGSVFGYWIGGIDLVWWTRGMLGNEQLKVLTFFVSFFLCATHTITCSCVEERILISREDDQGKEVGGALRALGEIWTTIKTLPRPIRQVFNVQFTGWIGWFPILFFSTTWVAEIYVKTRAGAASGAELATASDDVREAATRAGTHAMLWHSVVSLVTSIVVPPLVRTDEGKAASSPVGTASRRRGGGGLDSRNEEPQWLVVAKRFLPSVPFHWLTLPLLWAVSNGIFSFLLVAGTWIAGSVWSASFVIAAAGFCWAVTNWAPFAILGELILGMDSDSSSSSAALDDMRHRNGSTIRLNADPSRRRLDSSDEAETSLTDSRRSYEETLPSYASNGTLDPALSVDAASTRSLTTSPGPNRSEPPTALNLTPKAQPTETMNNSLDASFVSRSRSDTVQTESSFGSPRTARSAYFDAASSVEGDARSVASAQSGDGTPDYAGSTGSHTPRLGQLELGDSPRDAEPATPPRKLRRNRESVASTASDRSTIAYPPNHGVVGIDLFETVARGNGLGSADGPGQWYGSDPYMYHSGSTVHLPPDAGLSPPRFGPTSRSRSGTPRAAGGGFGSPGKTDRNGAHVLQVRHSDSFERSRMDHGRYSLDGSDKDGSDQEDDLVVHNGRGLRDNSFDDPYRAGGHHASTTPRIVVAGEDDDSLHEWDGDEAANSHGGDQTGVILGCHNIFLVLPQFLVTGLASIIFAIFAPHHSVLGHHTAVPAPPSTAPPSGSDSLLASIEEYAQDDLERRHLILRGLAAFGRAFVEHKRQEAGTDQDELTPGGAAGWDALGMIFRIGGISAAVSAWICYRMWREKVSADRRARAAARGYRIGG
ncbi:hypothetical protein JCM10908_001002 [Rhodotorula pacifica]|uniref:uncharacterized protein n=1 Tax=Rhodotorula pacifica TaxID=1495444 RepID=UPI00317D74EB